jgi:cellulose synthase/poly-beta-1,6-N-acetylglucosamine synthase-like glycosyltransferase
MLIAVAVVFVLSSLALLWMFAGYPLALLLLSKVRPSPVVRQPYFPMVSILVCTYNEAPVIERRLDNLLKSDYPLERTEILVIDSASPDGTARIVSQFCKANPAAPIQLICEDVRRGKMAAINLGLQHVQGDIVILTDGPALFWPDTVRLAMENFGDARVGAVTGNFVNARLGKETSTQKNEQVVLSFRKMLRRLESAVDSTPWLSGEFAAFRRTLIQAIPSKGLDDLYIAFRIREQGYRVIADFRAAYTEKRPETYSDLVTMKVKNIAGGTHVVMSFLKTLLSYRYGIYGLMIFPTKIMHTQLNPLIFLCALLSGGILLVSQIGLAASFLLTFSTAALVLLLGTYKKGVLLRPIGAFILSEWIILKGLLAYRTYTPLWDKAKTTR